MTKPIVIRTVGTVQTDIIRDILHLHCPQGIELDVTYSTGNFYKDGKVGQPRLKSDLFPGTDDVRKSDAADLSWLEDESVGSIMFDPPFIAGHTKSSPTGIMGERFYGFRYIPDLWEWYDKCIPEFFRVLKVGGVLIVKTQDTVSASRQWMSHVHITNEAEKVGFYTKDLFVLVAKNRIIGHNHGSQVHARKFHSYFIVFVKETKRRTAAQELTTSRILGRSSSRAI